MRDHVTQKKCRGFGFKIAQQGIGDEVLGWYFYLLIWKWQWTVYTKRRAATSHNVAAR